MKLTNVARYWLGSAHPEMFTGRLVMTDADAEKQRSEKLVTKASGLYLKNPIVRSLAQLVPWGIGGAVDTLVAARYQRMVEERRRHFFEELDRGERQLTAELESSDDFLHCFAITLRAVHRTRRHEKIQLFGRLFSAAVSTDPAVSTDEYEELLSILDELSVKDLKVLMALEEYETQYYKDGRMPGDFAGTV
jgi:hypothetical protein